MKEHWLTYIRVGNFPMPKNIIDDNYATHSHLELNLEKIIRRHLWLYVKEAKPNLQIGKLTLEM